MSKIEIPPPEGVFAQSWSLKKVFGMLAVFGPAAIVASVAIGAGETIVVVRAGAWAGYGLLWMVLLSCLVKGVFFTYLIGRYTAVSGELIGHRLVRLPGPRGWLLLTILLFEMIGAPLAWVPVLQTLRRPLSLLAARRAACWRGRSLLGKRHNFSLYCLGPVLWHPPVL